MKWNYRQIYPNQSTELDIPDNATDVKHWIEKDPFKEDVYYSVVSWLEPENTEPDNIECLNAVISKLLDRIDALESTEASKSP